MDPVQDYRRGTSRMVSRRKLSLMEQACLFAELVGALNLAGRQREILGPPLDGGDLAEADFRILALRRSKADSFNNRDSNAPKMAGMRLCGVLSSPAGQFPSEIALQV